MRQLILELAVLTRLAETSIMGFKVGESAKTEGNGSHAAQSSGEGTINQVTGAQYNDESTIVVHNNFAPPPASPKRSISNWLFLAGEVLDPDYPVLQHRKYVDEQIVGPAVIMLQDGSELLECTWTGDVSTTFIPLPDDWKRHRPTGLIVISNSTFERCTFRNVAIAGLSSQLDYLKRQLTQ